MRILLQRRDVLALICGTAAARVSGETLTQTPEKQRRIGVLINIAEDDPEAKARVEAFRRGLQERGWIEGRNAGLEIRYGRATPSASAGTPWSWSGSHPTSSCRPAA